MDGEHWIESNDAISPGGRIATDKCTTPAPPNVWLPARPSVCYKPVWRYRLLGIKIRFRPIISVDAKHLLQTSPVRSGRNLQSRSGVPSLCPLRATVCNLRSASSYHVEGGEESFRRKHEDTVTSCEEVAVLFHLFCRGPQGSLLLGVTVAREDPVDSAFLIPPAASKAGTGRVQGQVVMSWLGRHAQWWGSRDLWCPAVSFFHAIRVNNAPSLHWSQEVGPLITELSENPEPIWLVHSLVYGETIDPIWLEHSIGNHYKNLVHYNWFRTIGHRYDWFVNHRDPQSH